jgi:hypothetical protein
MLRDAPAELIELIRSTSAADKIIGCGGHSFRSSDALAKKLPLENRNVAV